MPRNQIDHNNAALQRSSWRKLAGNKIFWLLVCLLIAAFSLRLWGISFGLPQRYHIDETFYVALALKMPSADFDMGITTHGPNLFYFILLAEYVFYYLLSLFAGQVSSLAAFEQLYRNDPSNFVLLARITSVVSGTLTLLAVYSLAKKLDRTPLLGLISALLLGFSFQHIRESHYGTPDVFVTLLVTICLLACVNVLREGRYRDYILAGVFAGLATGTKFTNGLLWFPVLFAHVYRVWKVRHHRPWWRELFFRPPLWLTFFAFLISFAVAYPNLVLRPAKFVAYLNFLIDVGRNGFIPQFIIEPSPAWIYYPFSLSWGIGWLVLALVIIGLGLVIRRRDPAEIMLAGFVFIYFLFLLRSPYYASRYLLPLLPVIMIIAARAVLWLADRLAEHVPVHRSVLALGIVLLVLIQPASNAVRHNYLLGQTDTRTLAKRWIEENIPEGTTVAVDWRYHAPPLRTNNEGFPASSPQYKLVEAGGIGLPEHPVEAYVADGGSILIVSSFIDSLRLANPEDFEARNEFHEELSKRSLIYEIKPYKDEAPLFVFDQIFGPVTSLWQFERPGPALQIYRLAP